MKSNFRGIGNVYFIFENIPINLYYENTFYNLEHFITTRSHKLTPDVPALQRVALVLLPPQHLKQFQVNILIKKQRNK